VPDPGSTEGRTTDSVGEPSILLLLAFDHRHSIEKALYAMTAPDPQIAARISADKLLVYQALLDAVALLPEGVRPGILVDEQYGASVAELASQTEGAVDLAMPIEASGHDWLEFAYGADDWRRHAEFFATDQAKVLARDNPGFDPRQREQQAGRLADISSWALDTGKPLLIELLVPPTDAEQAQAQQTSGNYDDDQRPANAIAVIEYLQDRGVNPAIWKVEGLDRHDDAVAIVATARRGGRRADCIVLGRHASKESVDRWLRVAAPIPGFTGFAIGRSIWWDALESQLRGAATAEETRSRVRDAYVDFAKYYMLARDGELTSTDRSGT
jgi:myo-inositol catabolism protein IolC